jgi:hypothetical protein
LGLAMCAGYGAEGLFRNRSSWIQAALILVVVADLTWAGSGRAFNMVHLRTDPGIDYGHFQAIREIPGAIRTLTYAAKPPARVELFDGSPLWNNGATMFEVPLATGDDAFAPYRLLQVRSRYANGPYWLRSNQVTDLRSRVLDFLNVAYILSSRRLTEQETAGSRLQLVEEIHHHRIYRNSSVLPRFFLAGETMAARDAADAFGKLSAVDLARVAVVEGLPPRKTSFNGKVEVVAYSANRVDLATQTDGPAFLVSSETYHPDWAAEIDGKAQPIYITNGAFRGFPIPAGTHRVTMRFQPGLWKPAALAALAWVLCLACLLKRERQTA